MIRKDGSVDISKEVIKANVDLRRYLRFKDGETLLEIAEADNITPDAAKISLRIGRNMHEAGQLLVLRDLKYTGAIETEEIRAKVRASVSEKIVTAVDQLLTGERTVVETNLVTGQVTLHKIVDPEVVSMGITHARKIVSLDEKPAANQTTVNIQQNNNSGSGDGPVSVGGLSYEDRLRNIRLAQTSQRVIDTEIPDDDKESEVIDVLQVSAHEPIEMAPEATEPDKTWQF